ncbi:hypothetical protein Enr13x_78490 [Stieleria neptunia]|uniref:Uncharacterized protein n=1 Tax=Stieleria neptunia TaxID=2527979 RepID=A0A518I4F2_9BACT|nr:hypothetical protein Enr13x_78490 [Stieleria neptunia]
MPLCFGSWLWICLLPNFAPSLKVVALLPGDGVGQSEGYKIRRPVLPPVWKVSLIKPNGQIGIEPTKVRRSGQVERCHLRFSCTTV